ncbi:MAG: pyridine nucleotide-disulfide oxidoreductase [Deltaproteobacteria bacterium]|jgi:NADH oxidase (H2O2-forming)|nr:MAG: pyridine nucleotide-disulfide oxidoreductase [Deltaproteobacteria bacterium]
MAKEGLRIIVIGGGAAGISAASTAKSVAPDASVTLFTEFEDVAYSPCGIPFVHGREIPDFKSLFLQTPEHYAEIGIDLKLQTKVTGINIERRTVSVGSQEFGWDRLIIATGFEYDKPDIPGIDLEGLYYVKNIRRAMEFDKVLDQIKRVVVVSATPLGIEMAGNLAHRGLETYLVDEGPWLMSKVADPDIMEPVHKSLEEMGVKIHLGTKVLAFKGENGRVKAVSTTGGDIDCELVVVATHKVPNNRIAREAGIKIGATGGIVVDDHMRTSVKDVYAAGDCIEVIHGVTEIPIQGLSGSHAYSQGKVAGANAAGGDRSYDPVFVPWGMVGGKVMIGGVSLGETLHKALGIPHFVAVAEGISRARYYPGVSKIRVKLIADPDTLRVTGAQLVGGEGIKERADFLAFAIKRGATLEDFAWMENVYSPPIGALMEPIALAAQAGLSKLGKLK